MNTRNQAFGKIFMSTAVLFATLANGVIVAEAQTATACDQNIVRYETGFYGQYYNMSETDPGVQADLFKYQTEEGPHNYWYGKDFFAFSRVDRNISFGDKFFPVDTKKAGDPFHFATHWRSGMVVPTDGTYTFKIEANNDAWLYIDGNLIINLGKSYWGARSTKQATLTAGVHELNIYFAERSRPYSSFKFDTPTSFYYAPLPPGCSIDDVPKTPPSNNPTPSNGNEPRGTVLGANTIGYTPAVALWKTAGSPAVYAIYENGYRHYIANPTAFQNYGYSFDEVKVVSQSTLDNYPEARLVRTPDDPTIYFIYTRSERQWLKINIPSPTAFASYPENEWGNVAVVDELDVNAYPTASLIKTAKNPGVYLLKDNEKRLFLTADVFNALDYSWSEIVTVSPEHLNTYATGSPIG